MTTDTDTADRVLAPEPTTVDAEGMLAQIRELQTRMAEMQVQQGIPADPIAAGVQNMVEHVKARQAQNPGYDLAELADELDKLGETVSSKDADYIDVVVQEMLDRNRQHRHELDYLGVLARDLRKAAVKAERK